MLFLIISLKYNFLTKTKLINTKTKTNFIVRHKETSKWDFSDLEFNSIPFVHEEKSKNLTFYIRFAKELSMEELPAYADFSQLNSHFGANAVRCNSYTQRCDILSTIYEYDWTTLSDISPEIGVAYFTHGQPFLNSNGTYEEWEVIFEFRCNESSTSVTPRFAIDSVFPNLNKLHLIFTNKQSCGILWTAEPTPTPAPFNPNCSVYYRQGDDKNLAIFFNLFEWNGGALGIPVYLNTTAGKKVLFWQPCERMLNCPWGYNCRGASMSTAWLCDENFICQNFTTIKGGDESYVNTDLIDRTEINKGIRISYEDANNSKLQVDISCMNDYPNDHILFNPHGVFNETSNLLQIYGSSYEVCPKEFPEPIPPIQEYRFNLTQDNYFIDLDFTVFGTKSKKVEVDGDGENKEMMLYFAPYDSIPCPYGHDCNGNEDMKVILCEIQNDINVLPSCIDYGINDYGIIAALKNNYIRNGATTFYFSDRGRTADVDWRCNVGMLSHTYVLPDKVYLKNGKLFIDIQSIESCASGVGPFPTPPPIIRPNIPEEYFPTPSPVPSPEASYYFEDISQNEYIIIELSRLALSKPFIGENFLSIKGSKGAIHTEFHPWNLLSYPFDWGSSNIFDKANLWQCWYDNDFKPYCHSVADKRLPGLNVFLQKSNDIESGVKIVYNGSFGAFLEINISCDQSKTGFFDIADKLIYYNNIKDEHKWVINASHELACPNKFQPEYTPYPSNTPSPSGDAPETYYKTEIDGHIIELDLTKIKSFNGYIASGSNGKYSRNELLFSPIEKIGCPKGKICPSYKDGNVLICVNESTFCYPIGNLDYGLNINILNDNEIYGGVYASYEGGLYGSKVQINFFCDENIPEDELRLKPIDIYTPLERSHLISFMTSQVCPKDPISTPSPSPSISQFPSASFCPTSDQSLGISVKVVLIITISIIIVLIIIIVVLVIIIIKNKKRRENGSLYSSILS